MARQPRIPSLWLVSDARNDRQLEAVLRRVPRGAGLGFRHYHLDPAARRARFGTLARIARANQVTVVLAGSARTARRWGADGAYGSPETLGTRTGGLRLATAHDLGEIARATRSGADAL